MVGKVSRGLVSLVEVKFAKVSSRDNSVKLNTYLRQLSSLSLQPTENIYLSQRIRALIDLIKLILLIPLQIDLKSEKKFP